MYQLVNESEARRYRRECSSILVEACAVLKKEYNISSQVTLVGSGARNLITRNGTGPYDLDYNLEIIKAPENIQKDLRILKETVRSVLNRAKNYKFSNAQNSTSVLTCLLYFNNEPQVKFKFDVAIVKRNNGTLLRLIQNKWYGLYTWNEVPSSHNVAEKAQEIKNAGEWERVRKRYLEKKNSYISSFDHPSFIVYVETVNEIYNQLF